MYKKFDIVKVIKQPSNQFVKLVGITAIIVDEPLNGYVNIEEIDFFGRTKGGGTVPISCLCIFDHPNKENILERRIYDV